MSWSSLASNRAVNGVNLQDAVNTGVFLKMDGQTIPNTTKCLTRDQVSALVSIQPLSGNRLVKKSELVYKSPYYYTVDYNTNSSDVVDCGNGWYTRQLDEINLNIVNAAGTIMTSHPNYIFTTSGQQIQVLNGQGGNGFIYASYECGMSYPAPVITSAPIPKYGAQ